jgi:hypothetical protein
MVARHYAFTLGRFLQPDPITIGVLRVFDPQTLNLYTYARNNPLAYVDPTGKDIVSGTGDQKAIKTALVEIAKRPEGRAFLKKLDKLTAKIKVSTGSGLKSPDGTPAYGRTAAEGTDKGIQRVTDGSGTIVDIKAPNIETTVDFALAREDRAKGVPNAPSSDAELLGHELKHDEFQFFKPPNTEETATQAIRDILGTPVDKTLARDAERFVDDLLKPARKDGDRQPGLQMQSLGGCMSVDGCQRTGQPIIVRVGDNK